MTNRKASNTVELPIWLIVVLFAAIILIFLQTDAASKVRNYIPFFKDCAKSGGTCHAVGDCSQLTDNAYMTSTAKCKDDKICCIPDKSDPSYTPPPDDTECEGKKTGEACGTYGVCVLNEVAGNVKCESKCEYCANNPKETICKVTSVQGKKISEIDSSFKCGCTLSQCNSLNSNSKDSCVPNMCPSTTPTSDDYRCCNVQ